MTGHLEILFGFLTLRLRIDQVVFHLAHLTSVLLSETVTESTLGSYSYLTFTKLHGGLEAVLVVFTRPSSKTRLGLTCLSAVRALPMLMFTQAPAPQLL